MEYFILNNGTKIPLAGLGTFQMNPEEAEYAAVTALKKGYRLIDTANAYMNEKAVGRGMKKSGIDRKYIYLSTKLWPSVYENAGQAIDETLRRMDTDYIDLLFLHQPVGDYISAYKAMEEAVKTGKVKSLGLSNFSEEQIRELVEKTEITPAVVQVEAHPYYPETELKEFLKPYGTILMAWFPLGHGDPELLEEPALAGMAEKYGKTTAQIILRWHTQVGNIVIPGSKNETHIEENIELFDFDLTEAELQEVSDLNKNLRYYVATEEMLQGYLAFAPDFESQQ